MVGTVASAGAGPTPEPVPPGHVLIPCPKCGHHLTCDRKLVGTKGQCPACKYIFTIARHSDRIGTGVDAHLPTFTFSCPACHQLFEGQPEMEGRRGKCHVCGAIFRIELKKAEWKASTESAS
ncbi:MAG: hypothetical protein D6753_08515, partial [Planctomycetota bacterium]